MSLQLHLHEDSPVAVFGQLGADELEDLAHPGLHVVVLVVLLVSAIAAGWVKLGEIFLRPQVRFCPEFSSYQALSSCWNSLSRSEYGGKEEGSSILTLPRG